MRKWVDFKELRSKLDFADVLRFYKIEMTPRGSQFVGLCPLPKHGVRGTSPSFSVNVERGIFNCFSCGAKGNILDFAGFMEGVDIRNGSAMRKVAEKLQSMLLDTGTQTPHQPSRTPATVRPAVRGELPVVVNEPLDFELKGLDPNHPYLLNRGFTPQTIAYFGLGVAARGSLKGRLAIPLHDTVGRLIGYAGRLIDDTQVSADNPRYLFPTNRERDGVVREFRKTDLVYNASRMKTPAQDLIVVEGFMNVWWLHQNGQAETVGLVGTKCSDRQGELLIALLASSGRLWVVAGKDETGDSWAAGVVQRVVRERFCRLISLPEGRQPSECNAEELEAWTKP